MFICSFFTNSGSLTSENLKKSGHGKFFFSIDVLLDIFGN